MKCIRDRAWEAAKHHVIVILVTKLKGEPGFSWLYYINRAMIHADWPSQPQ
jgi:hypothetical protein